MDLGLYNAKYGFRKLLTAMLPALRNVSPNAISWSLVPVGLVTAAVYYLAATGGPVWLFLVGAALVLLRMVIGTLDGLVAVTFAKGSGRGEIVNRLAPELCDVVLLAALVAARPEQLLLGIAALSVAWLTTFAGVVGAVLGRPTQSVGPVGQTDRLAALILFSLAAGLAAPLGLEADLVVLFLAWTVLGGALTIVLRLARALEAAEDVRVHAR